MAGYRPKSLDELNNMYDKTMAAEKAIRKGTSLLETGNEKPVTLSEETQEVSVTEGASVQPAELSDAVNDFIAKYSEPAATKSYTAQIPEEKPRPQMTVLSPESPAAEASPVEKIDFPTAPRSTPQSEVTREQPVRRADRDELMDEYMKIMSDEDDDIPEKKLSRKEKKKKKKKEKVSAEAETAEAEDINPTAENLAEQKVQQTEAEESSVVDFYSQNEEEPEPFTEEKNDSEEKDDFDFPADYTPEWMEKDMTEEKEEKEAQKKGKKARKNKKDKKKQQNRQDVSFEAEEETVEDIESQKAEFQQAFSDEEEEKLSEKEKKSGGKIFLKVLLSLILVLLIIAGGFATALKTVFSINTGKAFNDSHYIFTAYKNYDDLSLKEGDLIVTEKVYAEDGDIFAYIDYSEKTFEFGKRVDSITNDDGEVLIVAEKNGSRTLVSRDDCKGVLRNIYPTVGKYVSFITDNFITVICAVAVAALIVVLILLNGFKSKKSSAAEEEVSENEEYENVFSTID